MNRHGKRALLAAGLIAGAAAMTGCTAQTMPAATPTPQVDQQETAQPAQASPQAEASPEAGDESPVPIGLSAGGKELETDAIREQGRLLLPLVGTAEALGYEADSESLEEETQTKRTISLTRDDSRITVAWVVSDNTARQITWQRDGMLVPVDPYLTTIGDVVYVPAAFFEEAMGAVIAEKDGRVAVTTPEPQETPPMQEETPQG